MKKSSLIVCLIAIVFLGLCVSAQTPTGTIQGVVTDAKGALVQGASVTIVRTTTNEERKATTDSAGRYEVVFVEPGVYNVTVEATGFKLAKQDNVLVQVTETRPVNFKLDVGGETTTVEVNAQDVQTLDTETSSLGETIQTETILQLPDQGRNPFDFAFLVPGVNNVGSASTPHIGGSRNGNNEQVIDGMTNITPENNIGNNISTYTPVEDSVQEINVQTNVLPAENGRFSGGTESLVTKSGGNSWHGTYFEFIQNAGLNASGFPGIGGKTSPNAASHNYESGGTASGPIIKNKAFFFFDYQYTSGAAGQVANDRVPDPSVFGGDFTSVFGSTTPVLFDPDTVAKNDAGVYVRQPFQDAGGRYNVIPAGRLSPVSQAALAYFPKPNIPGVTLASGNNNYTFAGTEPSTDWHFDSREDADVNSKWHTFLRYSMDHNTAIAALNDFQDAASNGGYGGAGHGWIYSGSFNNTVTFTPTLIGEFRYGYSRQTSNRVPVGGAFDPAKLGFDTNYVSQASKQEEIFPHFGTGGSNNGGFTDLGPLGYEGLQEDPLAQSVNGSLVKITGGHTLKFGGEFRNLRLNFYQYTYPSGTFSSDDSWTRQFPATSDGTTGYSIASMLLGLPSSGDITDDPKYITTSQYIAFYGQDDWKVTPKLTLNIGLRYDFEIPREEQNNQMVFWDPTAVSPLQGNVSVASSLKSSGVSCPNCGNLRGAMTIVGAPGAQYGRRQGPVQKKDFGPRFGLAYSATSKMVVRAGMGIVYQPSALQASGTSGGSGDDGFDVQTNFIPSFNNLQSLPVATLYSPDPLLASAQNPFPSGYVVGQGYTASCLASTQCTQGIDIGNGLSTPYFDTYRNPYSIQWNINTELTLPWGIKAEVGYLGNRGLFLINGDPGLPVDQLTTNTLIANGCSVGATTAQCALLDQVPNPFEAAIGPGTPYYIPGLALSGSTVSLGQLQHRFPQYNGVSTFRKPDSASSYNGFTFGAQKSAARGLSFTYALTYGKEYDNGASPVTYLGPTSGTYANQYNPKGEWGLGAQNVLWDIAASAVYELPFGHGRQFLNNGNAVESKFVNGWQISGIEGWATGTPIVISSYNNGTTQSVYGGLGQRPDWSGTSAKLSAKAQKANNAVLLFNPTVFSKPLSFEIGNAPRTIGVNNPSLQDLDLQIAKNTRFGHDDRYNVQFRTEMFNAFNHAGLGSPDTNLTDSNFGKTQSLNGTARRIQFALKFVF